MDFSSQSKSLGFLLLSLLGSVLVLMLSACAVKQTARSYQTPEATFETWKQAAGRLDFEALISCYSTASQPRMRKDLSATTVDEIKVMQAETNKTKFEIQRIVYEGPKAYLRVMRRLPGAEDIEVLTMIKEGLDWKLIP